MAMLTALHRITKICADNAECQLILNRTLNNYNAVERFSLQLTKLHKAT